MSGATATRDGRDRKKRAASAPEKKQPAGRRREGASVRPASEESLRVATHAGGRGAPQSGGAGGSSSGGSGGSGSGGAGGPAGATGPAGSAGSRSVGTLRTAGSGGAGTAGGGTIPGAPRVRRKCAVCAGKAWDDERPVTTAYRVRRCPACEGALSRGEAPPGGCTCGAGKAAALVGTAVATPGRPLDPGSRAFFEARYGGGFGDVRVHTGASADASARAIDALAFTVGRDVVFRDGAYAPATPAGRRVLAHELAHVVQQRAAPAPSLATLPAVDVGPADHPLEREADAAASAVLAGRSAPALSADASGTARPISLGFLEDAWDAAGDAAEWVGEGVVEGAQYVGGKVVEGAEWVGEKAEEAWEWTKERIVALIEEIAPGLLDFLRGDVAGMIRDKIGDVFQSLFGDLAGRIAREGIVGALSSLLAEATAGIAEAAEKMAPGACDLVLTIAGAIGDFIKSFTGPLFEALGAAAGAVADFFSGLWNNFAKPAWEAIQSLAGDVWSWIVDTATWLWDLTEPVRDAVSAAWDWLVEQFGIAWESATGVFDWLKEKAAEAWAAIKEWVEPILGPLKVVGGILVMLSPLGPVIAIGAGGAALWKGLKWLWENWDDLSIVVTARHFLSETVLPAVMSGIEWLKGALSGAMAWLSETLGSVVEQLGALAEALGANVLLSALSGLVDTVKGFFADAVAWIGETLGPVVAWIGSALTSLFEFLRPVLELTVRLVFIASNPWLWPMVITGWAWRLLPDCIKGPVIDWVLGVMTWAVEALPDFASLGEAWPKAKAEILKVLADARALPMEEKIRISDRIARIMTLEDLTWLWNMINAARQAPGEFEGQVMEELIGMDLTQPLPFERTKGPEASDLAAAASRTGLLSSGDASVLTRSVLTDGDVDVDQVGTLELDPALVDALGLADGGEVAFGENPDPAASLSAIRSELASPEAAGEGAATAADEGEAAPAAGEGPALSHEEDTERRLQEMMDAPGPEACEEKPDPAGAAQQQDIPEHMKIGPLTRGQRGRYMLNQMWKGIKHWWSCNDHWLVPTLIVAAVVLIAAEIFTGGAITAALPAIMGALGVIFIGVAVARGAYYVGEYIAKSVAGDIAGGAKALARAVAVAVVELVFALLFEVAALLKAIRAAAVAAARGAAKVAKTVGSGTSKALAATGKALAKTRVGGVVVKGATALGGGIRRTAGAALRNGKIVMRGVGDAVGQGARSLDDLARGLWKRVRFRRFKLRRVGRRMQLWGYLNPWVLLADGRVEFVDDAVTGTTKAGDAVKVGRKKGVVIEPGKADVPEVTGLDFLSPTSRAKWSRRLRDAPDDAARQELLDQLRRQGAGLQKLADEIGAREVRKLAHRFGSDRVAWATVDVPANKVAPLLEAYGPDVVRAVSTRVAARDMEELLDTLGAPTARGIALDRMASLAKNPATGAKEPLLGDLTHYAENLRRARQPRGTGTGTGELVAPPPTTAATVVADSNYYRYLHYAQQKAALGQPITGAELHVYNDWLARTAGGKVPDLRATEITVAETGHRVNIPREGVRPMVPRTSADYKGFLDKLDNLDLGGSGPAGAADRTIVADAMMSAPPHGTITFVTADKSVIDTLALIADPPINVGHLAGTLKVTVAQHHQAGGFLVRGPGGRTLHVMPIPSK